MDYLEIKAPAKINFGLNVTSRRNDGYHNIETVFYPLYDLYDVLTFSPCSRFLFESEDKTMLTDDNLIIKAKNLLEKHTGKSLNVRINLEKNIPAGAGMGGGSSDAAATLISLNEMFSLNISEKILLEMALGLGSDVPFFIKPRPAYAESRGEKITYIDFDIPLPLLIVN
ncbi:MAG: 4-(cytidine 5'-diphospho)-2-C-methyl-D-erythritol kinase, partial [Syntrophothermus sp.]